ncbi:aromatic compound dioxygenase [Lentinus tigrinus ALCF2SS1-7]|uniref:Aromatic compound dioxygenase n=1 Tax=Lentinus tigrinus ALCF2SS1-6 TaxID=1328759 RepID=A0A5C2SX27_9APHY|nr:aromatic compound dioxygenase [Lentinus tigrinus ALCF2SS1-6]RPD81394.1 aromatic compound dioxygenase [Lentinus tigrinus ALCF2SS1-7]
MATQVTTAADWAPYVPVSLFTRLISFARSAWVMVMVDNPVFWKLFRGKNELDDVEGPFYIVGAPQRQFGDGKMVLASKEIMQRDGPFLFILDVKDVKGNPIPNAVLDCWQADSTGSYYFASWTLRGKVTTDAQGHVEILSVRPADYGAPLLGQRKSHMHVIATGVHGKHVPITTQVYICPGNNPQNLDGDFASYARPVPYKNMATSWSISAANNGELVQKLPELPSDDVETVERVKWWNETLKKHGIEREIAAVARHELKLSLL